LVLGWEEQAKRGLGRLALRKPLNSKKKFPIFLLGIFKGKGLEGHKRRGKTP